MGEAVERLTRLVEAQDRFNIRFAQLRAAQIEAMNERFQERKDQIKLVGHRAREAGVAEVRSHEEVVKLLLPHTAYKSYPESWLMLQRWDRLSKWLDTICTHRVPVNKVATQTVGFSPFDRMPAYRDRLASGGAQRIVRLGEAGPSTI